VIYEIVNPSDAYTIVAADFEVATVACLLLGNGQYAFDPLEDGGEKVPLFLFGGADAWCRKRFGTGCETLVRRVILGRHESLAACLDSCLIGRLDARREYESALRLIETETNREQFRRERHDRRRSSLNDIGARAWKMAKNLREQTPAPLISAPPQVFSR